MRIFTKSVPGILDFTIDYASWLGVDTISASSWAADAGITIDSDTNTTTTATAVISGGTAGRKYEVVNQITTASGLVDRRKITVICEASR